MKPKSPPPKSVPELEAAALRALKGGHYKDAIAAFKVLLKRERRRDWEGSLAQAYLGRAREVALKEMFQEAAMLWENHAGLHPGTPPSGEYLVWLLRAGQWGKLGQCLGAASAEFLQSAPGRRLTEAVAVLALDNDKLLAALPGDHAIVQQQPLLKRAMAAYSGHRDAEAEDCLRQVSSRSPYRNLRTLLKGLLAADRDPAGARELLDRVETDSACRDFAAALREQLERDAPEAESYLRLPPKQRAVVDKLKGYGKAQLALLRDLGKAAQAKDTRPLLEMVLRHRGELGEAVSRRYCLAALVGAPEAIPLYERAFGKLAPFEQYRLKALHAEEILDYPQASRHWHKCIDLLKNAPPDRQDPLTQALIFRHIATLAAQEVPELALSCLEQSLALDPDDKASYLKLIDLHEREDDPKAGQSWLEQALKRYPEDPEVLILAMRAAQRRKAFKKVAGYASTLLGLDPINSQARRFLLEAHLGHARKQLKSERPQAAAQELAAARALDPQRRNAALLWLEGLAAYAQDDYARCRNVWREAWTAAGGGVAAWFQWAMEAQGTGLSLTGLAHLVGGLDKKHVAGRAELMALVKLLGQYREEGRQNLAQALQKLAPVLKRSFKQTELAEEDYLGLCQGFADAAQYDLLAECAKQGNRRCRFPPVFSYFEVYAKCKGDAGKLGRMDEFRLQMNLDQAHHAGDRRAAALIGGFLRKHEESLRPDFGEIFPGDFSPLEDFDEEKARQFIERVEEFDKLTPEERAMELLGEHSPEELQNLSEKEALHLILGKLFEGLDVDPDQILNGLPLPGGKKPKKKR
jgi:hypothetical protein